MREVDRAMLYRHLGGARQDNRIVPFGEPPSPPYLHRSVRPTEPSLARRLSHWQKAYPSPR